MRRFYLLLAVFLASLDSWKHSKMPYLVASSSIFNGQTRQLESFSLNCPHVADSAKEGTWIEVTWTLNDAIWLKIENGERRVQNKPTSFNKRTVSKKSVLRVLENNGRYIFDYDELTGDFSMEIQPVMLPDDKGIWQCHVTVKNNGAVQTLTSRRRIKLNMRPHTHRKHLHHEPYESKRANAIDIATAPMHKAPTYNIFNRPNSQIVEISRDPKDDTPTVIFSRQPDRPAMRSRENSIQRFRDAVIDYEQHAYEDLQKQKHQNRARSILQNASTEQQHMPIAMPIILYVLSFKFLVP